MVLALQATIGRACLFLRPFSSKRFLIERIFISFFIRFEPQSYKKSYEKASDKTENRMLGVLHNF